MTVTYPLTFPSEIKIKTISPTLQFINAGTKSPYTLERQIFPWPGEAWTYECNIPPCVRADAAKFIAFATKLRGSYGTFLMGDISADEPLGVGGGVPVVDGGSQEGTSLSIKGAPLSTLGWLLEGTYFQIGSGLTARLHMLNEDSDTDGTGRTVLNFAPALRYSPLDNAAIVLSSPKGLFNLQENNVTWMVDEDGMFHYSFRAIEALP